MAETDFRLGSAFTLQNSNAVKPSAAQALTITDVISACSLNLETTKLKNEAKCSQAAKETPSRTTA